MALAINKNVFITCAVTGSEVHKIKVEKYQGRQKKLQIVQLKPLKLERLLYIVM